jgi:beta-glucosidase-like glycosyl hydrolase
MGESSVPGRSPTRPVRERHVRDLLGRMTLAEKIGQICTTVLPPGGSEIPPEILERPPGIVLVPSTDARRAVDRVRAFQDAMGATRLRIPVIPVATGHTLGALSGALRAAATWDVAAVERMAAEEAASLWAVGVLATLGPVTTDDRRSPPFGGSPMPDPVLAAAIVAAQVRGAQGRDAGRSGRFGPGRVAVVVPLGAPRDGSWHERTMRSSLLATAEAAVQAGAAIVVPSRASNAGIPGHTDSWLLQDVLRRDWGFAGIVVAAEGAIHGLVTHHEVAGSVDEAIASAIESGVDVVGAGPDVAARLLALVETGALPRWLVDESVAAVLQLKDRMGLLDAGRGTPRIPAAREPRAPGAAYRPVNRSVVLLTDPMRVLPLSDVPVIHVVSADGAPVGAGEPRDRRPAPPAWDDAPAPPDVHELTRALKNLLPRTAVRVGTPGPDDAGDDGTVVVVAADPEAAAPLAGRMVAAGRRCVVLVCSERIDGLDDLATTTASILLCWDLMQRDADDIADVLVGKTEPEGRLPVGLPVAPTPRSVIYPLGHGSGYTTFRYSRLRIAPAVLLGRESVQVRCVVTNTGQLAGRDVVQVYLEHLTSTIARPGRSLAGFTSVRLGASQSLPVTVLIPPERLAVWDRSMRHVLQPGTVEVLVGRSADDIHLSGTLAIGSAGTLGPAGRS